MNNATAANVATSCVSSQLKVVAIGQGKQISALQTIHKLKRGEKRQAPETNSGEMKRTQINKAKRPPKTRKEMLFE